MENKKKNSKNLKVVGNYNYIYFTKYFKYFTWKIKIINFKNSEFCCFGPSILKRLKGQTYFYGRFHIFWPYLLTTKLRCLQKNNIGHTKVFKLFFPSTLRLKLFTIQCFCSEELGKLVTHKWKSFFTANLDNCGNKIL